MILTYAKDQKSFNIIFFFLGFWLKFSIVLLFNDGQFGAYSGRFEGTPSAFDEVLLVTSMAFTGLLLARFVRSRFLFTYNSPTKGSLDGLYQLYALYRLPILGLFILVVFVVGVINAYFGIYQRGIVSQVELPFGLNGVLKWSLLFGTASFSALLLSFEYHRGNSQSLLVAILVILETFISNVSLLSRGMLMNGGALFYGFYKSSKRFHRSLKFSFIIPALIIFGVFFSASILSVNFLRFQHYEIGKQSLNPNNSQTPRLDSSEVNYIYYNVVELFFQRWIGVEAVMAVSAYQEKNLTLLRSALAENSSTKSLSFYDKNFINSPYKNLNREKFNFISLPGIVAFNYYTGSMAFVLVSLFLLGLLAACFEWLTFKLIGAELILCALIGEVVAYRYMNFGFAPQQSYILFGALVLNILLILGFNKLFSWLLIKRQSTID